MDDSEVQDWGRLIRKVASGVSRDFPDTPAEDLEQNLWIVVLESQQSGRMMSPDEEHTESALWYAARKAAWVERKEHLTISPQYGYRTADVRLLLQTFFDRTQWEKARVPEDAMSELGYDGVEMSCDLSRAYDGLTFQHKAWIFSHFALGEPVDSKKLSRAISRMADILNTYQPMKDHDGPGRRTVITNAHARYLITTAGDGSD